MKVSWEDPPHNSRSQINLQFRGTDLLNLKEIVIFYIQSESLSWKKNKEA